MKIQRLITLIFFISICTFLYSCEEEEPTKTGTEETEMTEEEESENTESSLPEGFIVFETDTFYIVSSTRLNDPNTYRLQMNLATASDIGIASNDGNPQSTCALILSTKEAPTGDGSYTLISEQGGFADGEANLKIGFFPNNDYKYKSVEFFSTGGETFEYKWDNDFEITLPTLKMTHYFDETIIVDISGVISY